VIHSLDHECLGALSSVLTLVAYVPFVRSVVHRTARPHVFSWLIWTLTCWIGFAAQVVQGAGAGAWGTGSTALASMAVTLCAIRGGARSITRGD
jgi:hypothetical protein